MMEKSFRLWKYLKQWRLFLKRFDFLSYKNRKKSYTNEFSSLKFNMLLNVFHFHEGKSEKIRCVYFPFRYFVTQSEFERKTKRWRTGLMLWAWKTNLKITMKLQEFQTLDNSSAPPQKTRHLRNEITFKQQQIFYEFLSNFEWFSRQIFAKITKIHFAHQFCKVEAQTESKKRFVNEIKCLHIVSKDLVRCWRTNTSFAKAFVKVEMLVCLNEVSESRSHRVSPELWFYLPWVSEPAFSTLKGKLDFSTYNRRKIRSALPFNISKLLEALFHAVFSHCFFFNRNFSVHLIVSESSSTFFLSHPVEEIN